MNTDQNILNTGIEITNPHIQEKRQRKKNWIPKMPGSRSNDRKNTNSRKTQVIKYVNDSVWPPVITFKHIKHPSK